MRLKFYRELIFTREKAGKLMREDVPLLASLFAAMGETGLDNGAEDETEVGLPEEDLPKEF